MAKEDHAAEAKAAPELQDAADTKPPKAQQVHVSLQTITDTADYSPLGEEDRLLLDGLLSTVEYLFGCKTAEDYKALALQAMVIQSSSAALGENQPTDSARKPQALQVKGYEHKAPGTANYSPLGPADKLGLDILITTVETLFDHQTAKDYKALALQAAALCEVTDNARLPPDQENYMELVVQASATQSPSAAAEHVKPKHKDTTPQAVLSADT